MSDKSRADIWREIAGRHFGACLDQVWGEGRRTLIERLVFKDAPGSAVIVKQYERRVPTGYSKDWPELSGVYVYVPLQDDNSWEGADRALAEFAAKHK